MHRWHTLTLCTGPRGAVVSVKICTQCGLLWNDQTRKRVPICWGPRYEKPHCRAAWDAYWQMLTRMRADWRPYDAAAAGAAPLPTSAANAAI